MLLVDLVCRLADTALGWWFVADTVRLQQAEVPELSWRKPRVMVIVKMEDRKSVVTVAGFGPHFDTAVEIDIVESGIAAAAKRPLYKPEDY